MSAPADAIECEADGIDETALTRFRLLRPVLEDGVPITTLAKAVRLPERTLRRWTRRYRKHGMAGLARPRRGDRGTRRRVSADLAAIIEGLALERPRRSVAGIHRAVCEAAAHGEQEAPSYATVYTIVRAIDPALMVLAHEGTKAYAASFDLLHRREADRPHAIWQADHTLLDILVKDEAGATVRPWLTVVIDDHSRAIAAYQLAVPAPSALQTALALRRAIWRKEDAAWTVCGIPDVLYTDHGSDFISRHIEQVCAELKIRLVFSLPGQPRGRGRIERFFGTINTRCLAALPGYIAHDGGVPEPGISLIELGAVLRRFIIGEYHHTPHSATGEKPEAR